MPYARMISRGLGVVAAALVCLQPTAFAQMAPTTPMMWVQQTPHYTMELTFGPVQQMVSQMDMKPGQMGEVTVTSASMNQDMSMMSSMTDQGMAANRHLEVHVTQVDTGNVVMDLTPTIRVTDKATGQTRDLPQVMGMYGAAMGTSDFHYGQNVFLPDGTYTFKVLAGADTAEFRDVMVAESPMATDQSMGAGSSMAHP